MEADAGKPKWLVVKTSGNVKAIPKKREAVSALCKALRRSRADLKDPRRPIGTFALLGPTGVGKTLLAKTLAEQFLK